METLYLKLVAVLLATVFLQQKSKSISSYFCIFIYQKFAFPHLKRSAGKEGYFDPWAKFFNAKSQHGKDVSIQVINP